MTNPTPCHHYPGQKTCGWCGMREGVTPEDARPAPTALQRALRRGEPDGPVVETRPVWAANFGQCVHETPSYPPLPRSPQSQSPKMATDECEDHHPTAAAIVANELFKERLAQIAADKALVSARDAPSFSESAVILDDDWRAKKAAFDRALFVSVPRARFEAFERWERAAQAFHKKHSAAAAPNVAKPHRIPATEWNALFELMAP